MSVVLIKDTGKWNKAVVPVPRFLCRVDYPANWTTDEDRALRFTREEAVKLAKDWPFIASCELVPTDKILRVGLKES